MTMVLTAEFRLSLPLLVGISCLVLAKTAFAWQNSFDKPLHVECPRHQYISGVKSVHSNRKEDRLWEYRCGTLRGGAQCDSCRWYYNVNEMDRLVAFRCPGNQLITGVLSHHSNRKEDRVFSFRCCNLPGKRFDRCQLTGFINKYDGLIDYRAPFGYVIVGFTSVHSNRHEDRRWKVQICRVN